MSRMNKSRGITGRQKPSTPSREQALASFAACLTHNNILTDEQIDELADDHEQANFENDGYAAFGQEE